MLFGTVVHLMTLEPHRVRDAVAVMPGDAPDRRSKAGKEWHEDFAVHSAGKVVISAEAFDRATHAAAMVVHSPAWRGLIKEGGHVETSLIWKDAQFGVLCKARPDYIAPDMTYVVDVKTAIDASRETFARALWNLRYDIQARFYLNGIEATTDARPHSFAWCVVESEPPHGVAWYRISLRDLEVAQADIANGLDIYADCIAANEWPGYVDSIQDIRLPAWARRKADQPEEF
jgi:exodeoxyribonuclease VIII